MMGRTMPHHSPAAESLPRLPPDTDGYLSLKALGTYSGLSVRTLRGYLTNSATPVPHYRVGGKILVRRSEFDAWIGEFRVQRSSGVEQVVATVLRSL